MCAVMLNRNYEVVEIRTFPFKKSSSFLRNTKGETNLHSMSVSEQQGMSYKRETLLV